MVEETMMLAMARQTLTRLGRLAGVLGVTEPPAPTVFHITHWKAGSQWIRRILHTLAYDRLVMPRPDQGQFFNTPIACGSVYPTLYVTKDQFDAARVPPDHRRFVVIRDLRDTLISYYFSWKISHRVNSELMANARRWLQEHDFEAALLKMIRYGLNDCAAIQESWLRAGEALIRYEDLLENDVAILERVLLQHCELRVTKAQLCEAVVASRFEAITHGRQRGQEDVTAHERKGIRGDWRNHFTEAVKRAFKERFGELLIATGYETSMDW
jgi:lipopolysaccharide transport system ATP-binding protein